MKAPAIENSGKDKCGFFFICHNTNGIERHNAHIRSGLSVGRLAHDRERFIAGCDAVAGNIVKGGQIRFAVVPSILPALLVRYSKIVSKLNKYHGPAIIKADKAERIKLNSFFSLLFPKKLVRDKQNGAIMNTGYDHLVISPIPKLIPNRQEERLFWKPFDAARKYIPAMIQQHSILSSIKPVC